MTGFSPKISTTTTSWSSTDISVGPYTSSTGDASSTTSVRFYSWPQSSSGTGSNPTIPSGYDGYAYVPQYKPSHAENRQRRLEFALHKICNDCDIEIDDFISEPLATPILDIHDDADLAWPEVCIDAFPELFELTGKIVRRGRHKLTRYFIEDMYKPLGVDLTITNVNAFFDKFGYCLKHESDDIYCVIEKK